MHRVFATHRSKALALSVRHETKCRRRGVKTVRLRIGTCRQHDFFLEASLATYTGYFVRSLRIHSPRKIYLVKVIQLNITLLFCSYSFCMTSFVSPARKVYKEEKEVGGGKRGKRRRRRREREEEQFLEITAILSN